jgi:hypothetical protein
VRYITVGYITERYNTVRHLSAVYHSAAYHNARFEKHKVLLLITNYNRSGERYINYIATAGLPNAFEKKYLRSVYPCILYLNPIIFHFPLLFRRALHLVGKKGYVHAINQQT